MVLAVEGANSVRRRSRASRNIGRRGCACVACPESVGYLRGGFVPIQIHFLSEAFRPSEESAKSSRFW